ncbi:hypothetical protein KP509_14G041800 [Ceratopteris richardii]|uniref:EF-hand domain-containing protein n=1 Tax=Ceratopteris richardii TaxID=49495 RepID=A0A8T2T9Q8_CERRI|nr:hypothetical protein KP509_14G041800 [Ceratopteris richardii]
MRPLPPDHTSVITNAFTLALSITLSLSLSLSITKQQEHRNLFQGLDKSGDGRISKVELLEAGYPKKSFFSLLDNDGNGLLDFEECKSLFFVMKNKAGVCDGCGKPLLESYYGCVECHAFDLCANCYGARNKLHPVHPHSNFVKRKPMISSVMKELIDQEKEEAEEEEPEQEEEEGSDCSIM